MKIWNRAFCDLNISLLVFKLHSYYFVRSEIIVEKILSVRRENQSKNSVFRVFPTYKIRLIKYGQFIFQVTGFFIIEEKYEENKI